MWQPLVFGACYGITHSWTRRCGQSQFFDMQDFLDLLPYWSIQNLRECTVVALEANPAMDANIIWVGGLEDLFPHILGTIIPTDFHIFQRGRYTTNQS